MSESDVKGVKVNGAIDHSDSSTVPKVESPGRDVVADVLATKPGLGNGMNADTKSVQDDEEVENDSEAETLIQSPEKKRGVAEVTANGPNYKTTDASDAGSVVLTNASDKENASRKRKRFQDDGEQSRRSRNSSRHSSPLSSPSAHVSDNESARFRHDVRRKRPQEADGSPTSDKDVDISKKRRRRPSEILPPSLSHKRSKQGSIDATERRETRSATYSRPSDDERSPSPESRIRREHRRGASTQLTAHDLDRKKRGRPPNIQTRRNRSVDRASESSDDSGPRSRSRPQVHKFASQDHDTMSPAKVGPRKWKDKNGRTHLARACANEDLEMARAKLAERPGDLNMADNAGNTPLQIASLEGFESIVEFLLQAGAEVNVRNLDRDSPLIDAVENGHIEVIKLLLRHGANPRMGNGKGDEPLELVHPDDENRDIIRKMLNDAKDKISKKLPVTDIDISTRDNNSSRAASAASPRESPPVGTRSPPAAFGSRRRTGRSESTRNDLLWQANTQENLAKLASRGDVQGVVNILSILEKADTEALIAAAKAGHEEILQMLIAMGKPSPDPGPVPGYKGGPMFATPMLAAIGRGHPDVVKLLANQPGFNPMRRYKDRHYFELAKERRGEKWQQEYEILKQAYDKHAIARGKKTASPRKNRDGEKVKNRPPRRSVSPNSVKRQSSSPTITHKQLPKSTDTDKEKRKSTGSTGEKRKSTGSHEASEGSIAVASDIDQRVSVEKKTHRTRRSQSDLPPLSSIEDAPHKRRRLVTGKEHRKAQQSSSSSEDDDDMPEVKQEDKSQVALKRPRPSHSSDEVNAEGQESHEARATNKKRRTVLESSPDELRSFTKFSEPSAVSLSEERMPTENKSANTLVIAKTSAIDAPPAATEDKIVTKPKRISASPPKKTEAIAPPPPTTPLEAQIGSITDAQPTIEKTADVMSVTTLQENDESKAELESRTKLSEERKAREEEDKKVAAAAKVAEEARIKQEQAKIKAELEAKQKAEEQERIKQQRELEQREASQAAEREAQRRAKVEEEQRKRRQEEEEQERVAQAQKAKEDQRLRDEEEAERLRTEALPIVLCRTIQMLKSGDVAVRNPDWLSKFLPLYTVKAKQLDPLCDAARANDDWIPNFQVAGLFLTTDLSLRKFAQLERRPTTDHQRECLWRVARLKLSYDFDSTWATTVTKATEIESVAQKKFFEMPDLFWVKLSDVLGQILDMPHLNGLDLPRQPISLKTYDEVFGARIKALNTLPPRPHALPNGISTTSTIVTNGGNGTIH